MGGREGGEEEGRGGRERGGEGGERGEGGRGGREGRDDCYTYSNIGMQSNGITVFK